MRWVGESRKNSIKFAGIPNSNLEIKGCINSINKQKYVECGEGIVTVQLFWVPLFFKSSSGKCYFGNDEGPGHNSACENLG